MELKSSWCFMLLLAGAVSQHVNYPDPVCGVKGSTVTLLCTFTPATTMKDGREVLVEINRVVWCQNHQICQTTTPTVYDNKLLYDRVNNPRYRYLGDTKGNCSLQISGLQEEDDATLHFRMEDENKLSIYTGQPGVKVTVVDATQMKIRSSRDGEFKRREAVTLTCTTECTFHQLEVTWFRDGHALTYTGPSLHLGSLTAEDSGNYTCGLKNIVGSLSHPFSVNVEAGEEAGSNSVDTLLAVRLVLFSLHSVLIIIVASIVIISLQTSWRSCEVQRNRGRTV